MKQLFFFSIEAFEESDEGVLPEGPEEVTRKVFRRKKLMPVVEAPIPVRATNSGYIRKKIVKPFIPPAFTGLDTTPVPQQKITTEAQALNRTQDDPRCKFKA